MPRQTRYNGTLARPIEDPFASRNDEESLIASEEFVAVATDAKFKDLFIRYGMKPEDIAKISAWESLAYLLAFEHVPGLAVTGARNKGGHPKTVTDDLLVALAQDVDWVRKKARHAPRKTVEGACRFIAKSPDHQRWHPPMGKDSSRRVSVLRDRYYRGKRLLNSRKG